MTNGSLDLRFVPTRQLLIDVEGWRWTLAEIDTDPNGWESVPSTRAYIEFKVAFIGEEIERRRKVAQSPYAPRWPSQPEDRRALWDEIKQRLPMAELVAKVALVQLRGKGTRLICECPLPQHRDDGTPSFTIYQDQNSFYCFGCCVGGDVFEFARHYYGFSFFSEAADVLAVMAGTTPAPASGRGPVTMRRSSGRGR